MMRAVLPKRLLEERLRLGLGDRDEMWEGVLHLASVAPAAHGTLWSGLGSLLGPPARLCGLRCFMKPGVFDPDVTEMTSFRVPDLGYARPEDVSERGIEGRAVLVVEVLSPRDESYEKLPFYRRVGVEEVLFVDPTTAAFEVRRPDGEAWRVVAADDSGWTPLSGLGAAMRTVDSRLQVRTDGGIEEV